MKRSSPASFERGKKNCLEEQLNTWLRTLEHTSVAVLPDLPRDQDDEGVQTLAISLGTCLIVMLHQAEKLVVEVVHPAMAKFRC